MEPLVAAWGPRRLALGVLLFYLVLDVVAASLETLDVAIGALPRVDKALRDDLRINGLDYDELYASVMAYEAESAIPKPRPRSEKVEAWLGGVLYKSRTFVEDPSLTVASGRGLSGSDLRLLREPLVVKDAGKDERDVVFGDTIVRLSPAILDFGITDTCIPTMRSVEISYFGGTDLDEFEDDLGGALRINQVEVGDKQFLLANVYEPRILKPGSTMQVHVLYLPRGTGISHGTLTLHTSRGLIRYALQGTGRLNPYKAHDHVSTVPSGVRYEPALRLHNPHDEVLRVKEIFSTEGFLHMALPDAHDARVWEIPPGVTKEIMRLAFQAQTPGTYSAYVRIETDAANLIVPIDLTVLAEGLHVTEAVADFGVLTADDERHHISLDLVNTAAVPVLVQGVSLRVADPFISVIVQGSHVIAPWTRAKNALILTYQTPVAGTVVGALTLHTNVSTTPEIALPYRARRLRGAVLHSANTTFRGPGTRRVVLQNTFDVPLRLLAADAPDVSVGGASCAVLAFPANTVAPPGAAWPPLLVDCATPVTTAVDAVHLRIETNGSRHMVPLTIYPGGLVLESRRRLEGPRGPRNRTLMWDLGKISVDGHREETLNLTNFNPEPISIVGLSVRDESIRFSLQGLRPSPHATPEVAAAGDRFNELDLGYGSTFMAQAVSEHLAKLQLQVPVEAPTPPQLLVVAPGYVASVAFQVRPVAGGMDAVAIVVETPQETIAIHVKYTTVQGTIVPARPKVRLPALFPGKAEEVSLLYTSSFAHPVTVTALRVSDRRLQIVSGAAVLQPRATTEVAKLVVSPAYALACSNRERFADCMFPLPIGHKAPMLSTFGQAVTAADIDAHHSRVQRFVQLQTSGQTILEMKVQLDTDLVGVAPMLVRMPMVRPRLTDGAVALPLTHVGNTSVGYVRVENPANMTIHVALALEKDADDGVFTCPALDDAVCVALWRSQAGAPFMLSPLAMVKQALGPGETKELGPMRFTPGHVKEYVGRVYLRNTLSHIEPIVLRGTGGQGKAAVDADDADGLVFRDAETRAVRITNHGDLSLNLLGVDCPACVCGDGATGFCVNWPPTGDAVLDTAAAVVVDVAFTPSCYYAQESALATFMTSSGPVAILLRGIVTDPPRCLSQSASPWYVTWGKLAIWICFALVVGQMLYYTCGVVWADLKAFQIDDRFGYERPDRVNPDTDTCTGTTDELAEALLADMDAVEAEVQASWAFTVLRRPAVNKLLEKRKLAKEKEEKAAADAQRAGVVANLRAGAAPLPKPVAKAVKKKAAIVKLTAETPSPPVSVVAERSGAVAVAPPIPSDLKTTPPKVVVSASYKFESGATLKQPTPIPKKSPMVRPPPSAEEAPVVLAKTEAKPPVMPSVALPNEIELPAMAPPPPMEVTNTFPTVTEVLPVAIEDLPTDDELEASHISTSPLELPLDLPPLIEETLSDGEDLDTAASEPHDLVLLEAPVALEVVRAEASDTEDVETVEETEPSDVDNTEVDALGNAEDLSSEDDTGVKDVVPAEADDKESVDEFFAEIFDHVAVPPEDVAPVSRSPPRVKAPPGFHPSDADPTAVSLTYSHLQEQERVIASLESELADDDLWALGPLDDSASAFQAPLSLFGSSYFTGKAPGFIGSRAPGSRMGSLFPPSRDEGADLASLGGAKFPFESSKDVFLGSETHPDAVGRSFSFW
ncbi:hypothetical protein ACHHYP_03788 [Achlya hypogyna]|uniref:Secreted protein n=1 Tax=Achlya hypogyna TaxID=1202772 RepID=A0A0A7CNC3_ACHHY|nr:secreted protein [Achlya hypogyna]OQR92352.1 hypothetical protein ACHHYP_03788 [Achlya hypogyna]